MNPMVAGVQQTLNLRAFWKSGPGLYADMCRVGSTHGFLIYLGLCHVSFNALGCFMLV